MQEPQEQHRRFGRAEVPGARLLGRFVPWSTLTALCAMVLAVTGVAVVASGDDGGLQIDAAATGTVGDEIPVADYLETTSTTAAETTTTVAPTTMTTAVPPTTTAPPATVTTIAPGGADISMISAGGISFADGYCNQAAADWSFIGVCPDQNFGPDGRPELAVRFEPARYPKSARVHLEVVAGAGHDATYCLRLFDLTTRAGVAGSERCLTSPAVPPPAPYESWPPVPMRTEQIGPLTLSAGRYALQAKVSRASSGEACQYGMANCTGQVSRAQLSVDWG